MNDEQLIQHLMVRMADYEGRQESASRRGDLRAVSYYGLLFSELSLIKTELEQRVLAREEPIFWDRSWSSYTVITNRQSSDVVPRADHQDRDS